MHSSGPEGPWRNQGPARPQAPRPNQRHYYGHCSRALAVPGNHNLAHPPTPWTHY
ncbi:hypothetical protein EYF80_065453 [Liparis tanakae]|uniref:Uncharacterized protein n=1 Tax=Liparis tanakae TaxID=230148 RepID=A0A4Z2E7Y6_9TELE|nr:hypothetical protein EYF80_065453 [Liparis tanakae]